MVANKISFCYKYPDLVYKVSFSELIMLENFHIPDDPILDEDTAPVMEDERDMYEDLDSPVVSDYEPDWDPDDWN